MNALYRSDRRGWQGVLWRMATALAKRATNCAGRQPAIGAKVPPLPSPAFRFTTERPALTCGPFCGAAGQHIFLTQPFVFFVASDTPPVEGSAKAPRVQDDRFFHRTADTSDQNR